MGALSIPNLPPKTAAVVEEESGEVEAGVIEMNVVQPITPAPTSSAESHQCPKCGHHWGVEGDCGAEGVEEEDPWTTFDPWGSRLSSFTQPPPQLPQIAPPPPDFHLRQG